MDAGRFDALSRSLATSRSRRAALRGLGAGGLAAGLRGALGIERAAAASGACALTIFAKTAAGPHKNTTYAGTLNLQIGENGAIDQGDFTTTDGQSHPLVGQATGRALNVRITLADGVVLALAGTAEQDLILCRGAASGTFGGPSDTDLGTWRTGAAPVSGSSANAAGGGATSPSAGGGSSNSASGATSGGGTTTGGGGGATDTGGGGGAAACPSGVVCSGVCCAPAPGLTPDRMVCNAGTCECTYSCAAAGCPGAAQGSIVNTCGSDPEPHCHSECNAPADNGCGDMSCGEGQTLDVDSCTCMDDAAGGGDCGGADLLHDANNCGFCGVVCGSGFCQNGVCADQDPCPAEGRTNCNGLCMDTQNDPENCGGCGIVCPSGQCIEGGCTEVIH